MPDIRYYPFGETIFSSCLSRPSPPCVPSRPSSLAIASIMVFILELNLDPFAEGEKSSGNSLCMLCVDIGGRSRGWNRFHSFPATANSSAPRYDLSASESKDAALCDRTARRSGRSWNNQPCSYPIQSCISHRDRR